MDIVTFVMLLIAAIPAAQGVAPDGNISSTLARAEAAYYDARFNDAIALLAPVDTALDARPDRIEARVQVKLQLALAYIGLNQIPEAKARLGEIYEINPQFVMDPAKFAPKVLTLFNEVKASHVSDDIFRKAVEDYKRGDLPQSLSKFRTILRLNPNDVFAAQYLKLIQERLELSIGLLVLEWHSQFDAHDFLHAAETYRQLVATNLEGKADLSLDQIRGEYRKALTGIFQSWSQACKAKDSASVTRIGSDANELLPDRSIGEDILNRMTNCVSSPTPPVQTAAKAPPVQTAAQATPPEPTNVCIQNPATIAMARLKTRVEPQVPPEVGRKQVRVRAVVRIDDSGNTSVRGLTGGSPVVNRAVVKAVQNWKFYPAKVDNQPRCVETELPIELNP